MDHVRQTMRLAGYDVRLQMFDFNSSRNWGRPRCLDDKALAELGDAAVHAIWTLGKTKTGSYADGSRMAIAQAFSKDSVEYRGSELIR